MISNALFSKLLTRFNYVVELDDDMFLSYDSLHFRRRAAQARENNAEAPAIALYEYLSFKKIEVDGCP